MINLGDCIERMGKYQAFTEAICSNKKVLELGAGCPISEPFLYLSDVIHLVA